MKIIIAKSEKEFDSMAARITADRIKSKPDAVIGFATGNTTAGFHKELSMLTKAEDIDWSNIKSVNIDEFLGAAKENPMSVYARMFSQLLNNTNIKKENVYIPDSNQASAALTRVQFAKTVATLGYVDFQVLGIGTNGHLAMNEPGTPWAQDMFISDISQKTIADKALMWGGIENVPKHGISMGMRLLMQGKTQFLMAKGKDKAKAIKNTINGEITTAVPASALQLHPDVIVLLDEAAASLL